jgi:hypothetical protein
VAYCIADQTGNNWEVGTGVFNGTTGLTRVTVLASSNGGSLVNFSGGTQDVFCTAPAKYLDTFTSANQGVVPASGGGTANFLRADGTFVAPPSGAPASPTTSVQFNNSGAFGGVSTFTYNSGTDTLTVGNLVSANFTSAAQGLVPASGGGTANFLRADGTFAAPTASATPAGADTQIQFNNAGAFGASANFTYATATNTFTVGPAGATTFIETLAPTGSTVTGELRIIGKTASATNGNGGSLYLTAGNGIGSGTGGSGRVNTGSGPTPGIGGQLAFVTGGGGQGGAISFNSGNGSSTSGGSGQGGEFSLRSGTGPVSGGSFLLQSGSSTGGQAGNFSFGTGSSIGALGPGGEVNIFAGTGTPHGSIYLDVGGSGRTIHVARSGTTRQLGFFAATPKAQAAAYTKTYSTASRVIPNATFTNLDTTAATNVAPYGFTTSTQADAIATKVNALAADVLILKQLIVSLVDDLSKTLGVGLNNT